MSKQKSAEVGSTHVKLGYAHVFSMVQIKIDGEKASESASVVLHNVMPSASLNLKTGTVTPTGTKSSVTMKLRAEGNRDGNYYFRAIVPALVIQKGDKILTVSSNGVAYDFAYSSDVPYEIGKLHQVNVTLGETPEESTITIENTDKGIEDWGNSDPISGTGTITWQKH